MTLLTLSWVSFVWMAPAGSAAGPSITVEELVGRIQAHYDGLLDFQADFRQRYERRVLGKTIEESGTVTVKKPGRMRWEYTTPEEKLFVTDGEKSYFYLPEENQVMVSHAPRGAMGLSNSSPFSLLAGRTRLTDAFVAMPSDARPEAGGVMLELLPQEPQEEFDKVELEVVLATGQIKRVVLVDNQGNRTDYRFDNIRENQGISDSLFRFAIPSGVEILTTSGGSRP